MAKAFEKLLSPKKLDDSKKALFFRNTLLFIISICYVVNAHFYTTGCGDSQVKILYIDIQSHINKLKYYFINQEYL